MERQGERSVKAECQSSIIHEPSAGTPAALTAPADTPEVTDAPAAAAASQP